MAQPIELLTVFKTLLLQSISGTGSFIRYILDLSGLSFDYLHGFFANWLKLDLTTLAAALTIFGTISSIFQVLRAIALKIYWWFTKFLTASISIGGNDRLNKEILNWLGAQVLTRQETRVLTARTEIVQSDVWHYRRTPTERNDYHTEKRIPIQYLPTFGTTWFVHERNLFLVRRICPSTHYASHMPAEYADAPEGEEPLVVMCLGLSSAPIKRFFETCRDFAEKQRESFITIRASRNDYHGDAWETTILRPIRPLETVHFDEATKDKLVKDISSYLEPSTRAFYTARGIPYRRGILLWGPPGTGKTSLSLALAGMFGLELYLVHLPSVREDSDLENLFTALPPRCMVLMEDIDAVGIKRRSGLKGKSDSSDDDDDNDNDTNDRHSRSRCTLSGVLNVLDGVSSQEGRIVLMTSNMAHKLDKALVRPGRIDKMIFLGHISQRSAELMFLRMYTPESKDSTALAEVNHGLDPEGLQKLALKFSVQIPEGTFTPADLQGYLLNHRSQPAEAVAEVEAWVIEEKDKMEEERQVVKRMKAKRAEERRAKAKKLAEKSKVLDDDTGSEDEKPAQNPKKPRKVVPRKDEVEEEDGKKQVNGTSKNEGDAEIVDSTSSTVNGLHLDLPGTRGYSSTCPGGP